MNRLVKTVLTMAMVSTSFFNSAQANTEFTISDVWAKQSIPGAENGAAYFTITNQSSESIYLVGANTKVARAVEVHEHIHEQNVMRMRRVGELEIAANKTVTFAPGGLHLMMFGIKEPLKPGQTFEIQLLFKGGETQSVLAEVRPI
ncbi:MAG: copper chaperone PCu(A)C [Idiomarina sp.]